jgi:hypothetical protein
LGCKEEERPFKGFHLLDRFDKTRFSMCKIAVLLPMQAAMGSSNEDNQKSLRKKCSIIIL